MDKEKIEKLEEQIRNLQEIVLIMVKGGCSKEYLENKISSLESDFSRANKQHNIGNNHLTVKGGKIYNS